MSRLLEVSGGNVGAMSNRSPVETHQVQLRTELALTRTGSRRSVVVLANCPRGIFVWTVRTCRNSCLLSLCSPSIPRFPNARGNCEVEAFTLVFRGKFQDVTFDGRLRRPKAPAPAEVTEAPQVGGGLCEPCRGTRPAAAWADLIVQPKVLGTLMRATPSCPFFVAASNFSPPTKTGEYKTIQRDAPPANLPSARFTSSSKLNAMILSSQWRPRRESSTSP